MDMFVTFISNPFISTELLKSLNVDSVNLQPDNTLFEKILSNFLGTLQLQQGSLEIEENTLLPVSCNSDNKGIPQFLSSLMNKDIEDITSESDIEVSPIVQEKKTSDYYPEDIYQKIIFLSKEIYNYLLQSGELTGKLEEQLEKYVHELSNNKGNSSFIPLKDKSITNDLISNIKECPKFINYINMDKNGSDPSDSVSLDSQILKTSLLPSIKSSIKEVIQFLNTEKTETDLTQGYHSSLDESRISDIKVSSYTSSGNGDKGVLEKDVIPVFIREIKSFLYDANIRPLHTEDTLTASEDIAHGEMSNEKGHNQMSNFNKSQGTENTFFTIGDSNVREPKAFEIHDKTITDDVKQNNSYTVSKKEDASIEISIEPDGIGEVDIELVLDKGVINAHISASDTIGKEFFERNLDNIMRALINEGLNIGNFSVFLQNKRGMVVYRNKEEDIKDIQITDTRVPHLPLRNEGLISIFV
ncbi:MAG: flagellar hook-length control protein FliK [Thermodesulfovibrionales bacterium]